ncbi:MAG: hypothetical protein RR651_04890 [Lysinibacillus sp.]
MKKLFVLFFLSIFIVGCDSSEEIEDVGGAENAKENNKEYIDQFKTDGEQEVVDATTQKDDKNGFKENKKQTEILDELSDVRTKVEGNPVIDTIDLNQVIKDGEYSEAKIIGHSFTKLLKSSSPNMLSTLYKIDKDEEIFLDITVVVESFLDVGVLGDNFVNVLILYDNELEFVTYQMIEVDEGEELDYTQRTLIEPFEERIIHFVALVPTRIENSQKPLKAIISVNNGVYEYIIR